MERFFAKLDKQPGNLQHLIANIVKLYAFIKNSELKNTNFEE